MCPSKGSHHFKPQSLEPNERGRLHAIYSFEVGVVQDKLFCERLFQAYRKEICAVILMNLPDRYASYTNAPNSILSLIDAGTSQRK